MATWLTTVHQSLLSRLQMKPCTIHNVYSIYNKNDNEGSIRGLEVYNEEAAECSAVGILMS